MLKRLHFGLWCAKLFHMKRCPKCRRNTYSEKWERCSACERGGATFAELPVESRVAFVPKRGEKCPTCGYTVPKKSTERVKRFRDRIAE